MDERGDRRLAVARDGPVGAEHEQPRRVAPAQHRGEQVERRVVGPVQVLEHERERRRGADRVERLEHLAQHPRARRALRAVAHRLGVGALVEQPRQLDEPGRRALGERGDDRLGRRPARQLAERLEHRHVRLARPAVAEALADARDAPPDAGEERVDERALADARLAAHHHAGAAARRPRAPSAARSRASSGSRPTGAGRPRRRARHAAAAPARAPRA